MPLDHQYHAVMGPEILLVIHHNKLEHDYDNIPLYDGVDVEMGPTILVTHEVILEHAYAIAMHSSEF